MEQAEVESRFEALHPGILTPLIGRDEELELLLHRWRQAKDGNGQLVLLCGRSVACSPAATWGRLR